LFTGNRHAGENAQTAIGPRRPGTSLAPSGTVSTFVGPPAFTPDRPEHLRLVAMHQRWCRISFLHWPVDPRVLQTHLPAGLVVDACEGMGWVGLTPFHLRGLRPPGLPPMPWLSQFPEMNLRTYVRGPVGPGVWFFSLDADSALAVLAARLTYALPYRRARMRIDAEGSRVRYTSVGSDAVAAITVDVGEPLSPPDELALFLTERYRLYTRIAGRLATAAVEHRPWPLHRATLVRLVETVRQAASLPEAATPPLVHYSPGVRVRVGLPRRLPPSS
jgi:uncharacterized protein YqjF (DUF2071 family)